MPFEIRIKVFFALSNIFKQQLFHQINKKYMIVSENNKSI